MAERRNGDDPEVVRMLTSIAETRNERDDLRRHNEHLDRELAIAKSTIDRLEHELERLKEERDQAVEQRTSAVAEAAGMLAAFRAVKATVDANDPDPKLKRQLLLGSPPRRDRPTLKANGPASDALSRLEADLAAATGQVKQSPEPAAEEPQG